MYYVDHNTRTTTWQRPNQDMISNLNNWHQWRQMRSTQLEQLAHRFLFPQQPQPEADPLGQLPEEWGKSDKFTE